MANQTDQLLKVVIHSQDAARHKKHYKKRELCSILDSILPCHISHVGMKRSGKGAGSPPFL